MAVSVVEAIVEIKNRLGLHLRAAKVLAQTATQFQSDISIVKGKNLTNAKSITAMMMLGAAQGAKLKVRAEGDDAEEALKAMQTLFADGFGED